MTDAERSTLDAPRTLAGKASPCPVRWARSARSSRSPRLPQLLGDRVGRRRSTGSRTPSPVWLWLAGARLRRLAPRRPRPRWRSALTRCGGTTTRPDAAARYCTGSLVNAVAPAKLGTAVRFALFARVLPNEGRLWTAGGIATSHRRRPRALARARARARLAERRAAALADRAPAARRSRRRDRRLARALDTSRHASSPTSSTPSASSAAAHAPPRRSPAGSGSRWRLRLAAATAIAAAFGVDQPLVAALLDLPALDLAGILPITPGNVGVASAAVAFALTAHGVGSDVALSAGIAFGAVETLTTLALGCGSLLYFAGCRTGRRAAGRPPRPQLTRLLRARRRVRRDRARSRSSSCTR